MSQLDEIDVQVVTDKSINLKEEKRVLETVVDSTYKTKSGALNKARALQFCLEEDNNILKDEDWIVHLDEETLLTDSSVRGILNFINSGQHSFGQGIAQVVCLLLSRHCRGDHLRQQPSSVQQSPQVLAKPNLHSGGQFPSGG